MRRVYIGIFFFFHPVVQLIDRTKKNEKTNTNEKTLEIKKIKKLKKKKKDRYIYWHEKIKKSEGELHVSSIFGWCSLRSFHQL